MLSVFKSNIFKGFLFVVFMVCDGMSGVLQNNTEISISDRKEFLNMTANDFKDVVSITFENQTVDDEFYNKWDQLKLCQEFDMLSFKNCKFLEDNYCIFSNLYVKHLMLNYCGVSANDIDKILEVDPYVIKSIDLSNNNLCQDEKKLEKILTSTTMAQFAMNLILKDNNLSKGFENSIKENNKNNIYGIGVNFIFN